MHEPIDWSANPINALFRLVEFADAGEPLPPEMIAWLADGARDFIARRSPTIGRALGIESEGRGHPDAMTRWRRENARVALLWMSQLIDLGANREQAATLARERMLRYDKPSALTVTTLKDAYSRSSFSKLQRRVGVGAEKMSRADVVAFLAEFPHDRFASQTAKKRILALYPK
jgi:hypothetical protein